MAVSEMEFTDGAEEEVRVPAAPRSGPGSQATGSSSPRTETTPSAAAVASFDMVVIGAGPAGEKAAAQAAFFGKRVAIVERRAAPGGALVSSAGAPTKTLRETALYLTGYRRREVYGLSIQLDPDATLDRLLERTAQVQAAMAGQVRENIARHQIEMVPGTGSFGPNRTVVVTPGRRDAAPRTLQADIVLVATGSRPFHAPDVPFDDPDVYDSERILGIDRIPRSMVVVGGGPVGCEYASIFTSLGTEVVLLDSGERLLPFVDGEISRLLGATFSSMGVRLVLGSGVGAVRRADGELQVTLESGEVIRPEKVLFAAGRAGNTEGLGLEEVSVQIDARGRIVVDEEFRTTAKGIYAAGDVIGPPALASVSMEQGRVAACHAFGIPFKETVDPLPPYGIYSIPEVAMVGLTEEAATRQGIAYEVGRGWFSRNIKAVIDGGTDGLVKLVFRREDRVLLGVHILGDIASELIHQGQAVMHEGAVIDRFIHATFNIPTRSEAYKYAAYDGLQRLAGLPGAPSG